MTILAPDCGSGHPPVFDCPLGCCRVSGCVFECAQDCGSCAFLAHLEPVGSMVEVCRDLDASLVGV